MDDCVGQHITLNAKAVAIIPEYKKLVPCTITDITAKRIRVRFTVPEGFYNEGVVKSSVRHPNQVYIINEWSKSAYATGD